MTAIARALGAFLALVLISAGVIGLVGDVDRFADEPTAMAVGTAVVVLLAFRRRRRRATGGARTGTYSGDV